MTGRRLFVLAIVALTLVSIARWLHLLGLLSPAGQDTSGTPVVSIAPALAALYPGTQVVASIDLESLRLPPESVVWEATGGTITSNGFFTAGDTPGAFLVVGRGVSRDGRLGPADTVTILVEEPPIRDSAIDTLPKGIATFVFPDTMLLGQVYRMQLNVRPIDSHVVPPVALTGAEEPDSEPVRLATRMVLDFSGVGFTASGPSLRSTVHIQGPRPVNWTWHTVPNRAGWQPALLTLSAVVGGAEQPALAPVLQVARDVYVRVPLWHRITAFLGAHWHTLVLLLISAPALAGYRWLRDLWNDRRPRGQIGFRRVRTSAGA